MKALNSRRIRTVGGLLVVATVLVTSAACGSSSSGTPAASQPTTPTTTTSGSSAPTSGDLAAAEALYQKYSQFPTTVSADALGPLKSAPKKPGTVFWIACIQTIPGCVAGSNAMKLVAQAVGWTYKDCNMTASPASFGDCLNLAIQAKPTVVAENGADPRQAGAQLTTLKKMGIPVVGQFSGVEPYALQPLSEGFSNENGTITSESALQGTVMAAGIAALSKGKANAVYFGATNYPTDYPVRYDAIKAEWAKICPGCQLAPAQTFDLSDLSTTLGQQIQAYLTAHPSVTWVVCGQDATAVIAAQAIRQAGLTGKVQLTGMDGAQQNIGLIKDGEEVLDAATANYQNGFAAMDLAFRYLEGTPAPGNVEASNILLLTKANVARLGASEQFQGPAGYINSYKKLWKTG